MPMFTIHVHPDTEALKRLQTIEQQQQVILDVLGGVIQVLTRLNTNGEAFMATLQQLKDALEAVRVVTNTIAANVMKVVANETAQLALIEQLKAQVAAGGTIGQAELDQLVASATARKTALESVAASLAPIATDLSNPAPEPPPVELPPAEQPPAEQPPAEQPPAEGGGSGEGGPVDGGGEGGGPVDGGEGGGPTDGQG